jgi:hypothetical protein
MTLAIGMQRVTNTYNGVSDVRKSPRLEKNSEIHTMEFAIASLNRKYIHTISIIYP